MLNQMVRSSAAALYANPAGGDILNGEGLFMAVGGQEPGLALVWRYSATYRESFSASALKCSAQVLAFWSFAASFF